MILQRLFLLPPSSLSLPPSPYCLPLTSDSLLFGRSLSTLIVTFSPIRLLDMPLPFLPPELISEIISHLRDEDHVDEQIRDGKAVSLASKSWASRGQALRWRTVEFTTVQIPSLYRHFAQYPHLDKSVRRLVYAQLKEEQSSEESCGRMAEIVTNLVNLEAFEILGQLGQHLSSVVQAASTLLKLRVFAISSNEENDTTDDVIRSFSTGFNNLRHLHFRLVRLNASN